MERGWQPSPIPRGRSSAWLAFLPVAVAYLYVATYQIELPGVYMDAVNPDYIAARALNPDPTRVPVWILPGNLLLDRFPLLTSLYYGTQQFWLGLPVFWLLGTTVTSLRIAHSLFALAVLATVFAVMAQGGVRRWWAAAICTALAIDASFVYAFRTQSYITMAPVAWLLLSVWALQRRADDEGNRHKGSFTSGLFLGLAVFGYFVYAFYAPALAIAVLAWRGKGEATRSGDRLRSLALWVGGIVVGVGFYILGYLALAHALGGMRQLFAYIAQTQELLEAFSSQQALWERVAYAWQMVRAVLDNWWHHTLIFGEYGALPAANWKTAILVGVPATLWAVLESRGQPQPLLRLFLGLELSFFAMSVLTFGTRLGGHHYVSLLALSYCALGIAMHAFAFAPTARRGLPGWSSAALILVILVGINGAGQIGEATRLRQTHGVGLYSDAINRFAEDLRKAESDDVLFTPDWGLFMPLAFLTGGALEIVTDNDYAQALRIACAGRRVRVALINGDRQVRLALWQRELGASEPEVRDYYQFDGKIAFQVGTFTLDQQSSVCRR